MSGPYGPNDTPGPGEGRNDPTQVWGGQQPPGAVPQWGNQPPAQPPNDPQQALPTQQWGGGDQSGQQWQPQPQQWSQPQPQPQQPQPQPQQWSDPTQQQWGQQPPPQQWGDPNHQQQPQPQWGDPNQQQQPQQQWGDPNQQQWGQQPQAQSGQWGQPAPQQWGAQQQPAGGGGKKTGMIVGFVLLGVVVVAAVVIGFLMLTAKDELDQAAVQTGVAKVLQDSYGIDNVKDVRCPAGQEVAVDATFTCDLKVGGEDKSVNIKITKEDGTYEVGRPS